MIKNNAKLKPGAITPKISLPPKPALNPAQKAKAQALAIQIAETQKQIAALRKQEKKMEKQISQVRNDERAAKRLLATHQTQQAKTEGLIKQYYDLIKKECSQYLKTCGKQLIYRGVGGKKPDVYRGVPHTNRQAMDTNQDIQDSFDEWLKSKKFKAVRGNSIFVSGDYYQADGYGKVYIIVPRNGFAFTWSPDVSDFTADVADDLNIDDDNFPEELAGRMEEIEEQCQYIIEGFDELLEDMTWTEFFKAIKATPADIKLFKSFYGLVSKLADGYDEYWPTITKWQNLVYAATSSKFIKKAFKKGLANFDESYLRDLKDFIDDYSDGYEPEETSLWDQLDNYNYKNTDLAKAIKSENEILINGSYYAFEEKKFRTLGKLIKSGA